MIFEDDEVNRRAHAIERAHQLLREHEFKAKKYEEVGITKIGNWVVPSEYTSPTSQRARLAAEHARASAEAGTNSDFWTPPKDLRRRKASQRAQQLFDEMTAQEARKERGFTRMNFGRGASIAV